MRRVMLREAARTMGLSEYALRNAVRTGRFPGVFIGGRWLVSVEEIEDCLNNEAQERQQEARTACGNCANR